MAKFAFLIFTIALSASCSFTDVVPNGKDDKTKPLPCESQDQPSLGNSYKGNFCHHVPLCGRCLSAKQLDPPKSKKGLAKKKTLTPRSKKPASKKRQIITPPSKVNAPNTTPNTAPSANLPKFRQVSNAVPAAGTPAGKSTTTPAVNTPSGKASPKPTLLRKPAHKKSGKHGKHHNKKPPISYSLYKFCFFYKKHTYGFFTIAELDYTYRLQDKHEEHKEKRKIATKIRKVKKALKKREKKEKRI